MKQWTTVLLAGAVVVLLGCPPSGVVCREGTVPCGLGCVDTANDVRNCGACGKACGASQECTSGACTCTPGTTLCDGSCVVFNYDARHCGACNNACAAGQVCEQGQCRATCSVGSSIRCGDSCVDPLTDAQHCGRCDNACAQGQVCRAGGCGYEAVAACYWSGQAVGLSVSTGSRGPLSDFGTNPGALARYQGTLLAADGTDNRLYQAVANASGGGFSQVARANATGAVPNQVLVASPYVYIANAGSGTLQVLKEGADGGDVLLLDAGVPGGVALGTVAELPLGMNSYPQGMAKVGEALWIPLYGGFGATAADAGQEVLEVSVATPEVPQVMRRVSLKDIDLKPFDGGSPVARPFSITAHRGAVYVALNNLNPDTYAPEGPGLLARIDVDAGTVSVIDLGAAECLNPQWVAPVGSALAVSCGGKVQYSPTFTVESVSSAGLVLLNSADVRVAAWSSACPPDAGVMADGGPACPPMMPGRFTSVGQRIVLTDQNAGRIVFLDTADGGLTATRGVTDALNVCPVSPLTGAANVSDVVGM
ncbi:MAG: MXAN_6577-like cysteine-rich protein [Myxococcota bacterium]